MFRYLTKNYAYCDPILNRVRANPGAAFSWKDALSNPLHQAEAECMMNEAAEYGLGAGFAVPMVTLEGDFATISFGGDRMDLSPSAAGLIHLVGVYAIGRAFQLQGRKVIGARASLTTRELDCVNWCAEGKTDWEISIILGISESTVRSHLNAARYKLNSTNKTHLVAEALRAGLIR